MTALPPAGSAERSGHSGVSQQIALVQTAERDLPSRKEMRRLARVILSGRGGSRLAWEVSPMMQDRVRGPRREQGLTPVRYGLLVVIIAAAIIATAVFIGDEVLVALHLVM